MKAKLSTRFQITTKAVTRRPHLVSIEVGYRTIARANAIRLRLVLIGVIRLDISPVISTALSANGVEDDAQMIGLQLTQRVAHALKQSSFFNAKYL